MAGETKEYVDREGLSRLTENIKQELTRYVTKDELGDIVDLTGYAKTDSPEFTGTLSIDGTQMYIDEDGKLIIYSPMRMDDMGMPINPESTLVVGEELELNGVTFYHSGNLKDLTQPGNVLWDDEKSFFMSNTGLYKTLGDIETALDSIITIQNNLIGGDA